MDTIRTAHHGRKWVIIILGFEIGAELNLKPFISEVRETAQALYEFADHLEMIDNKYEAEEERIENDGI